MTHRPRCLRLTGSTPGQQLEKMPQHTQFMLMNTHKSDDFYAEYTGVPLENLLKKILLPSATNIIAYSPDGYSQFHPLTPDPDPIFYHVFGMYPAAQFYYDPQADMALSNRWLVRLQRPLRCGEISTASPSTIRRGSRPSWPSSATAST